MTGGSSVAQRLDQVREAIEEACAACGRDPAGVLLIAVSKGVESARISQAIEAGQVDFGENYLQHALPKMEEVDGLSGRPARWHMIGRLQSNKAAKAARRFDYIHCLDSASASAAISRAMHDDGKTARVLIQVRLGGGDQRGGIEPAELQAFADEVCSLPGLSLEGLMGVAPLGEAARPHFARLAGMLESLRGRGLDNAPLTELSMGMSGDFREAILEGATMVRIGTAIFGPRADQGAR